MRRLLLLNWRDVESPRAGGAERVTHEIARQLVARGWEVTWLSSALAGRPAEAEIDGVRVVRRGTELTTRLHAPALARRTRPHVVLEEINTLPYFAPAWSSAPVVLYMNQIAGNVWWYEAPLPIAAVGRVLEPLYLRPYRHCDVLTISASSRDDLRSFGLRGPITVAPIAADVEIAATLRPKRLEGSLVAIGRLTPSKRFDHAILALAQLLRTHPAATLTIVGDGRERVRLEQLANRCGVAAAVRLVGRVTEAQKIGLLDAADVLVGTSVREGWGLTVTEAAARGTPAVVYAIPGFRDAVVDGRTGLLAEPSPAALAERIRELLADEGRYEAIRTRAWRHAPEPTLEPMARVFEDVLTRAVSGG